MWDMASPARSEAFTAAAERCVEDIEARQLTHDGDARLRHAHNARRYPNKWGVSLWKGHRESARKVDLAVCMVGARMVRRAVLNVRGPTSRRTNRPFSSEGDRLPLSPKKAVSLRTAILNGARIYEHERLESIRGAARTRPDGGDARQGARCDEAPGGEGKDERAAARARQSFAQSMRVDGYRSAKNPNGYRHAPPWETWQANGCAPGRSGSTGRRWPTARRTDRHSRAVPEPATGETDGRSCKAFRRGLTAVYEDPVNDDYPMLALYVDGPMLRLYDETSVYYIGVEKVPPRPVWRRSGTQGSDGFTFIERRDHNSACARWSGSVTGSCSTTRTRSASSSRSSRFSSGSTRRCSGC
jgi:hypothetical protein